MANPYAPYLAAIEDAVYDSPGRLFRVRIIILATLLGLVAFLTIVRFVLLLVEFRRREERLWLAKWVKRSENQRFLVTHQRPINMIMVLVSSVILLAYVIRLHELYGDRISLPQAAGWRNFSFLPLVLHGWLSGWSVLQSHLVVLESKGKSWGWWVAPLANTAYFASTAVMFIPLVTVAAVTTSRWRRVWTSYYQLHALLEQLEASWTPEAPFTLPPGYSQFSQAVHRYLRFSVTTKALYAVIVAITAIINTVALNLYYVMRKQINFNMQEISPVSGPSSRRPSHAQVRELASHGVARAQRVQSLQYASSTVIQISFAMIFGGILFATCFGWAISVPTITLGRSHPVRWGAVECSAFLVVWIYALFYLPLSLKLIRDAWINLPNKETGSLRTIPPEDTLAHFFFERRGGEATLLPLDGERISLKGVKRDTVRLHPKTLQVGSSPYHATCVIEVILFITSKFLGAPGRFHRHGCLPTRLDPDDPASACDEVRHRYPFVNAFSQLGNVAGAYIFPSAWGPSIQKPFVICISCFVMCMAQTVQEEVVNQVVI